VSVALRALSEIIDRTDLSIERHTGPESTTTHLTMRRRDGYGLIHYCSRELSRLELERSNIDMLVLDLEQLILEAHGKLQT
jgi:hypothetical protein